MTLSIEEARHEVIERLAREEVARSEAAERRAAEVIMARINAARDAAALDAAIVASRAAAADVTTLGTVLGEALAAAMLQHAPAVDAAARHADDCARQESILANRDGAWRFPYLDDALLAASKALRAALDPADVQRLARILAT
jgi:membrane carboxypeptidase/penicillin-binding protein PbpC